MHEFLQYKEQIVTPALIQLVDEEAKFYLAVASLFERLENFAQALNSVEGKVVKTVINYDPYKFIRGRNLLARTDVRQAMTGQMNLLEKQSFLNKQMGSTYGFQYNPLLQNMKNYPDYSYNIVNDHLQNMGLLQQSSTQSNQYQYQYGQTQNYVQPVNINVTEADFKSLNTQYYQQQQQQATNQNDEVIKVEVKLGEDGKYQNIQQGSNLVSGLNQGVSVQQEQNINTPFQGQLQQGSQLQGQLQQGSQLQSQLQQGQNFNANLQAPNFHEVDIDDDVSVSIESDESFDDETTTNFNESTQHKDIKIQIDLEDDKKHGLGVNQVNNNNLQTPQGNRFVSQSQFNQGLGLQSYPQNEINNQQQNTNTNFTALPNNIRQSTQNFNQTQGQGQGQGQYITPSVRNSTLNAQNIQGNQGMQGHPQEFQSNFNQDQGQFITPSIRNSTLNSQNIQGVQTYPQEFQSNFNQDQGQFNPSTLGHSILPTQNIKITYPQEFQSNFNHMQGQGQYITPSVRNSTLNAQNIQGNQGMQGHPQEFQSNFNKQSSLGVSQNFNNQDDNNLNKIPQRGYSNSNFNAQFENNQTNQLPSQEFIRQSRTNVLQESNLNRKESGIIGGQNLQGNAFPGQYEEQNFPVTRPVTRPPTSMNLREKEFVSVPQQTNNMSVLPPNDNKMNQSMLGQERQSYAPNFNGRDIRQSMQRDNFQGQMQPQFFNEEGRRPTTSGPRGMQGPNQGFNQLPNQGPFRGEFENNGPFNGRYPH